MNSNVEVPPKPPDITDALMNVQHEEIITSNSSRKRSIDQTELDTDNTGTIPKRQFSARSFGLNDKGPFEVIISSKKGTKVHTLKAGKLLKGCQGVLYAIPVGKNISVCFKTPSFANSFVDDNSANTEFDVFIPLYRVQISGVIQVEPDISPDIIVADSTSSAPLLKARRINSRKGTELLPTQNVVIHFEGTTLPKYVYFNYIRFEVRPYIQPVLQCFNCLRFGHTANACKSKTRCRFCASEHSSDGCLQKDKPTCIFCKGEHDSSSRTCPEYSRQKNIRIRMAYHRESFSEANKACAVTYRSTSLTPRLFSQVLTPSTSSSTKVTGGSSFPNRSVSTSNSVVSNNRFDILGEENYEPSLVSTLPRRRAGTQSRQLRRNNRLNFQSDDSDFHEVSETRTLDTSKRIDSPHSLKAKKHLPLQKTTLRQTTPGLTSDEAPRSLEKNLETTLNRRIKRHLSVQKKSRQNTDLSDTSILSEIVKICVAAMRHPLSDISDSSQQSSLC